MIVLEKFSNAYPYMAFPLMEHLKVNGSYSNEGFNMLHAVASYADVELLDRIREGRR